MQQILRYLGLWGSLIKFSLLGELAFRVNFLVKIVVEILWLAVLVVFNFTLFAQTQSVAGWNQNEYLLFIGCYFTLGGVIETVFLENCNSFADWVRTGEFDFFLLKPVDAQFLVSCRRFDWSTAPNILLGLGVMAFALWELGWAFQPWLLVQFVVLMTSGIAMLYGFLIALTSASIWFMRNQSMFEMWWLFTTLMRYPREIFYGPWASPIGFVFSFVVPILLVTNVPARVLLDKLESPWLAVYAMAAAIVVLWVSRRCFVAAIRRYRSASS